MNVDWVSCLVTSGWLSCLFINGPKLPSSNWKNKIQKGITVVEVILHVGEVSFVVLKNGWKVIFKKKKLLMAPFYGWGSTASRLEPLRGGSLLFTTKFPEIPGTHFMDPGRMKCWVDLGATWWFWTRGSWTGNPAP